MGTEFNKAIVAAVMAIIYILNNFFGMHIGITEDKLNAIIVILTPILVYIIPNKEKK